MSVQGVHQMGDVAGSRTLLYNYVSPSSPALSSCDQLASGLPPLKASVLDSIHPFLQTHPAAPLLQYFVWAGLLTSCSSCTSVERRPPAISLSMASVSLH